VLPLLVVLVVVALAAVLVLVAAEVWSDMDITYGPPAGSDVQPVMNETMRYWKQWMRRQGAGEGFTHGCSTNWTSSHVAEEAVPSEPVEAVENAAAVEGTEGAAGASVDDYSDYEEHGLLMDATVPQLRALMAMMRARGIRLGTQGNYRTGGR
jgi:hypothetical protein